MLDAVSHEPDQSSWDLLSKSSDYAVLAINWRKEVARERKVYVVEGLSPEGRSLATNDADCMTTAAAILERMIFAKIGSKLVKRQMKPYNHYQSVLGEFKEKVVRAIGEVITPVSPEEFVDLYKGRKRTIYDSYLDDFIREGVTKLHAVFRTFMKVEKVPFNKSPRTIQPRSPIYNIGLGRFLKPNEKRIFKAIARVFGQKYVVYKGMNANQMGENMYQEWCRYSKPVAVGIDASRFDASVDRGLLQWEHSVYNTLFRDRELMRLLNMQLDNVGKAYCQDGTIKYKVSGGRGSGDMNTSLGNSLIMCGIVWAWLKQCGVKGSLINNGDDCVVIMEESSLTSFSDGFNDFAHNLGFTMVVELPVIEFEDIEFCQTHPVAIGGSFRMVRNVDVAREKDSMCLFPLDNAKAAQSWMYAVGECGLALCSGMPIMQSFYQAYMRNGRISKMSEAVFMQSGSRMMAKGMEAKTSRISATTRDSFFQAFGYTPDEQMALEAYYDQWKFRYQTRTVDRLSDIGISPF